MGRKKCGAQTVECAVIEERQKLDAGDKDRRGKHRAQERTLLLRDGVGFFGGGFVGFQVGFGEVVFQWISVFFASPFWLFPSVSFFLCLFVSLSVGRSVRPSVSVWPWGIVVFFFLVFGKMFSKEQRQIFGHSVGDRKKGGYFRELASVHSAP